MSVKSLVAVVGAGATGGLLFAACVFGSDYRAGGACTRTSDCGGDELVCVLLDEDRPQDGAVCMPMRAVDAPASCTSTGACAAQGFPVDATCEQELCACQAESFACNDSSERRDPHTCLCVLAPPECLVDAGPPLDDAGTFLDAGPCD